MNYYNDIDANACAWIEELISQKLIPAGDVDRRSILEISPDELKGYTQCHFFAGVAGWSLALALARWPEDRQVWTGSCPCQPLSCAGLGKGHADERHLWPAFYTLIAKCRPAIVFGEQVASADGREWFSGVRADLEGAGYACGGADLCAAGVGSPNIRQRLFWVADSNSGRREQRDAGKPTIPISATNGPTHGMTDMLGTGLQGYAGNERDGNQPGRIGAQPIGSTPESGELVRLANAPSPSGSEQLGEPRDQSWRTQATCDASECPRSYWIESIVIPCRDGKHRRIPSPVEPGFLRMAHGIPEGMGIGWILGAFPLCEKIKGRTALLRGFGNAINPVVAAEFIQAFMETES